MSLALFGGMVRAHEKGSDETPCLLLGFESSIRSGFSEPIRAIIVDENGDVRLTDIFNVSVDWRLVANEDEWFPLEEVDLIDGKFVLKIAEEPEGSV